MLLALVLAPIGLAACASADPCLRRSVLRLPAPDGGVSAMLYPGACAGASLAPQVALSFPRAQGVVILGASGSVLLEHMRWRGPDRLELVYRSARPHRPVSRRVVLGETTIRVSYHAIPLRRTDAGRLRRAGLE